MRTTSLRAHNCALPGPGTVSDPFAEIADRFAHNNPLSASFSKTVCTLGTTPPRVATPPAPGGGIALHEGPTRRRHAVRLPRVVQNPHHCQHGGRTPLTRPSAVPIGAKNSPNTGPPTALARKNSPNAPENSLFRPFQACGANFFALTHTPGRAGRTFSRLNETATAFASSFTGAHETSDAFARPQCPKIKHFARAKVPTVSPHHEDRAAMAPAVSARPHAAPNRQAMHRLTHHCTSY